MSDPYELAGILARLELPQREFPVKTASDMLVAFAAGCDPQGRYYAKPALLARLFHWERHPLPRMEAWRDALVDQGELEIRPDGLDCYSGAVIDVAYLTNPRQFQRFGRRRKIAEAIRTEVYRRDKYRCVTCGSRESLTLDHILPWSLGGLDVPDNLQTMCQPCNSRKGARAEVSA